jgi:putative hemolysin
LFFDDKKVRDFMTPREEITYLKKSEMLGPLVLDELHKSGHSLLPVIAEDIDHVVGVLDLSDLMTLKARQSVTADKAMTSPAYCIAADQPLRQALQFFLTTHQRLILVISKSKRIIGLLTLNDVMQALLGDNPDGQSTSDAETPIVTPIKNE